MPTPPPWWKETHEAPLAVLSSAFRMGQSATASEPSRIASVSRKGEATEPVSRWSRPMATGAFNAPRRTSSLMASPISAREPQPAVEGLVFGEEFEREVVRAPDVCGVARERDPAEGAFACAEERADV